MVTFEMYDVCYSYRNRVEMYDVCRNRGRRVEKPMRGTKLAWRVVVGLGANCLTVGQWTVVSLRRKEKPNIFSSN